MDYNINLSHCIKEAHSFGSDTYYNICSGVNHVVPWGSLDWACCILLGTIAVGAIIFTVATVSAAIYDIVKYN